MLFSLRNNTFGRNYYKGAEKKLLDKFSLSTNMLLKKYNLISVFY